MIKGKIKKHNGKGYVCYLDILGFSFDIMNNWNNPYEDPLKKILKIKQNLPIKNPRETSVVIDTEEKYEYVSIVKSISDSIIISFGLDEKPILMDMMFGLLSFFGNIKHIWLSLIKEGYTVRGAIDYGDIYWDEDEIIGPALINAYRLESDVARISRVVISSDLNKVIKSILTPLVDTELYKMLISNFRKDIDGYITYNPTQLPSCEEERFELIGQLNLLRDKVKDTLIKEKYTPLINILEVNNRQDLRIEDFGLY